jgi:hypothetical protein
MSIVASMNIAVRIGLGVLMCASLAAGQSRSDDAARHRPGGVALDGHEHAHPGVDLTHPIVTESPLPETHVRVDYSFADAGSEREHGFVAAVEYAFMPSVSLEAVLPYVVLDAADADTVGRVADAAVAVKWATYGFINHRVLPAVGVEVILPTGNEVEPFVRIGYWAGPFEFIGSFAVGIPINQTDDEDDEEDFAIAYNLSTVYHVARDVQALLELHGESVFGDADESEFFVSPGVTFQPFNHKAITFGVGATVPMTDSESFDYAINVMTIVHF